MKRVKNFRRIQEKNKILGLEFADLFLVVLVYLVVFMFSKNLFLNLGVVFGVYCFLRIYKKGKPPHWTASLIRFVFTPRSYQMNREMEKELFR